MQPFQHNLHYLIIFKEKRVFMLESHQAEPPSIVLNTTS